MPVSQYTHSDRWRHKLGHAYNVWYKLILVVLLRCQIWRKTSSLIGDSIYWQVVSGLLFMDHPAYQASDKRSVKIFFRAFPELWMTVLTSGITSRYANCTLQRQNVAESSKNTKIEWRNCHPMGLRRLSKTTIWQVRLSEVCQQIAPGSRSSCTEGSVAEIVQGERSEFYMDWIHPWIGLDWMGLDWMTVTPF